MVSPVRVICVIVLGIGWRLVLAHKIGMLSHQIPHFRSSKAPSCIIPPAEDVAVRPYLVPLLPTFHGMENENPYTHIRDFEKIYTTFKEGAIDMDLLKLKYFPLTSKTKQKFSLIH